MKRIILVLITTLVAIAPLNAQTATPAANEQAQTTAPVPVPAPQHPQSQNPHPSNPFGDINSEENKQNDDHFMSDFINMLFTLGLLIVFILIVSWLMKKFLNTRIQNVNASSAIKIIERRPLTPKTVIYLLEINNRNIVIADHSHGVTKLTESGVEDTEQEEETPEKNPAFDQILKDKMSKDTNPY